MCPAFESVQALKFHLQDLYCVEHSKRQKRSRPHEGGETNLDRTKRSRSVRSSDEGIKSEKSFCSTYSFVDETKKTFYRHQCGTSTPPPSLSKKPLLMTDQSTDEGIRAIGMLASPLKRNCQVSDSPKFDASNDQSPRQLQDAPYETQSISPQMLSKVSFKDDSSHELPGLTHSGWTSPDTNGPRLDELELEDFPDSKPDKCELSSPDDDALFSQHGPDLLYSTIYFIFLYKKTPY